MSAGFAASENAHQRLGQPDPTELEVVRHIVGGLPNRQISTPGRSS